jgi:hypothetical protein
MRDEERDEEKKEERQMKSKNEGHLILLHPGRTGEG